MLLLFHVEVAMPDRLKKPIFEGRLRYGTHSRMEALSDRYGSIVLPVEFSAAKAKLIEAEVDSDTNQCIKQVWRQPLDEDRDIVLVITNTGFVKTVWVNLHSDKHHTLNRARYVGGH